MLIAALIASMDAKVGVLGLCQGKWVKVWVWVLC